MKKRRTIIIIALLLLCIVGYLFYSRPMTIQQRYPMLTLDKCTEITGYYKVDEQIELTEFSIEKDSKEFQSLWTLLIEKDYRRSLKDIFPRGTRIHPTETGDFQWEVIFHFDDVVLNDGSIGSGGILRIQIWYGELDIHFDGEILACNTDEQETWEKVVFDLIQ